MQNKRLLRCNSLLSYYKTFKKAHSKTESPSFKFYGLCGGQNLSALKIDGDC